MYFEEDEVKTVKNSILFRKQKGEIETCVFCKSMYTCEECPACKVMSPPKVNKWENYMHLTCVLCQKEKRRLNFDNDKTRESGREEICRVCKKKLNKIRG